MQLYIFGEVKEIDGSLSQSDVKEILSQAKKIKKEVRELKASDILDVFQKVSDAWLDENYKYRKQAIKELPSRIGFSPEMIVEGIKTMCELLSKNGMGTRMQTDLESKYYLDDWLYNKHFQGYIKAQPLGVISHISAGNVFVGGVDSLIQGLATKNVNIMKMSSVDPVFPVLFAKSLKEFDHTGILHKAMGLLLWKGGTKEIEKQIKKECDAVIVYGGADTIRAYREDLGLHTKLIEYGPKYSFMLISKDELKNYGIKEAAKLIARDAIMWEQSACSSPHVVYTEGKKTALKLMHEIGKALDKWAVNIPAGTIYEDEAVEITKVRELAKVQKAMGKGDYYFCQGYLSSVIYQDEQEFQTSCHNRTLFVKSVDNLKDTVKIMEPMGEYIQTVAILAKDKLAKKLSAKMAGFGADRFVEIGRMAVRKHGTPHDGTRGLAQLVRWVSLSRNNLEANWDIDSLWKQYDPKDDGFDFLPDNAREELSFHRAKNLVEFVSKKSPILKKRYKNINIKSLKDITKLPLMQGDDYKKYLPPHGVGLLTSDKKSGFVFSSGGTTGEPKVVYRTTQEQHFNTLRLGKGLSISVFGEGDVVANLLFAGNMWASFISYTQAIEHTGAQILPIAGNNEMSDIVEYLLMFKANAIITIPSVLLSVAEYVQTHNIDLKIKKVSTGGEHLFKESREYLSKVLGIEQFASVGYTTNDTGAIGYQCEHCKGGVHHVHEDLNYMEILDLETNEPITDSKIGKIVVTNLQRTLMPTIRYEVGDVGRWVDGKCKCGRKTKRFELLGRSDDIVIIGGGNITPEVIFKAISSFDKLSSHFQLEATLKEHKDLLIVKVETKRNIKDKKALAKSLKDKIYKESKELRVMAKEGLICDIEIQILDLNTIARNPRTGKIQLIADKRNIN